MSATLSRTSLSINHTYAPGDEGADPGSGSRHVDKDGMRKIKGAGRGGKNRESTETLVSCPCYPSSMLTEMFKDACDTS